MVDEDARIAELLPDDKPEQNEGIDVEVADQVSDENYTAEIPVDFDSPDESSQEHIDKSMLFTDEIEDIEDAADSELADFDEDVEDTELADFDDDVEDSELADFDDEAAETELADFDDEADKAAYAIASAAVNGYQESGSPEPVPDEQEVAVSTAQAKKSKKALFQFSFTPHRLLIIALVVVLFGTIGAFASVRIFGGERGKPEPSETAQYVPSEMPYRFGDGAKVAEERGKERQKAEEERQNAQGDSISIVSQLYPQKEKNSTAGHWSTKDAENRTDTAILEAGQTEGIPGPNSGELPDIEQNSVDNVIVDDVINTQEEHGSNDVSTQPFPEWEEATAERNILMEIEKPFDIEAVSFQVSAERLITGRLDIVNHTSAIVENVFLELELMYDDYGVDKRQFQYAYVANVSLKPGQSKNISYAALPPEKWRGECKLENIYVAAFDTTIDKTPYKVYVDRRNGLLELLERFI